MDRANENWSSWVASMAHHVDGGQRVGLVVDDDEQFEQFELIERR